jgi:hypothetical protein
MEHNVRFVEADTPELSTASVSQLDERIRSGDRETAGRAASEVLRRIGALLEHAALKTLTPELAVGASELLGLEQRANAALPTIQRADLVKRILAAEAAL